jgi:DNA-binding HxlR family transcriptional regulator
MFTEVDVVQTPTPAAEASAPTTLHPLADARIAPNAADVVALVADKWVIEVLHALRGGDTRYGQMQRRIPTITKKMLTQTLRKLERNGIVTRQDFGEVPPRVEYTLTPAGHALIVRLTQMCEWSKAYFADVMQARAAYDAQQTGWI